MNMKRSRAPQHLFSIRELDFSEDLFTEPLRGTWLRLAARNLEPRRVDSNVVDSVFRESILIPPRSLPKIYDRLDSVGDVLHNLGKPEAHVQPTNGKSSYAYGPYHQIRIATRLASLPSP